MAHPSFHPTGSILQDLARSIGFEVRLWEYRLQVEWETIVGASIAAHTRPERIRFRKLSVVVENSVWLQQLMFLKQALLENIQARMEKPFISDIVFRVGTLEHKRAETASSIVPVSSSPPSPEVFQQASSVTAGVADSTLRSSLTKVIVKALSASQPSGPGPSR